MTQENIFGTSPKHELNTQITLDKAVLKSGLQKAIRLCDPLKATRIAKSFMALDANELLRRLPVITLEDVTIHSDIDRIVDLYKASGKKAFEFTDDDRNFVLRYVWQIAGSEWRDNFWKNNPDGKQVPDLTKLTDKQKSISEAVEYRASAGGLAEDPPMMRHQLRAWQYRWTVQEMGDDDTNQFFPEPPKFDWDEVDYAQLDDIPLNAFDFHVVGRAFNKMIVEASPRAPEAVQQRIRRNKQFILDIYPDKDPVTVTMNAVWRFWVATNYKKQILSNREIDWFLDDGIYNAFPESEREKLTSIWNQIKDDVENLSKWAMNKRR